MTYQRKKQVEAQVEAVRDEIHNYKQLNNKIWSDPDLTVQGKEKRSAEELNKLAQKCKRHLNQAAEVIRAACSALERTQNADDRKTDDAAHQMRLANAIKALELRGRSMTDDEIIELATPLSHDRTAKMTLVAAAQAGGCDPWRVQTKLDSLFESVQDRSETLKKLRDLEKFVKGLWDRFGLENADFSVCVAVTERLSHWNDELTYWNRYAE